MSMIRLTPDQLKQMVQNSIDYRQAQNAATGSKLDANANVSVKNVATEEVELVKDFLLQLNRTRVSAAIQELYGTRDAQQYLEDLGDHFIYTHDETSIKPYCTSISMYPFVLNGLKGLGGDTTAPKHLRTFVGGFINLLHAIASQFAGAVATVEFLTYFDHFARMEYGQGYSNAFDPKSLNYDSIQAQEIRKDIYEHFAHVIYTINQPAANRGYQAIFWNISIFDQGYFENMFEGFVFPDLDRPNWASTSVLQREFLRWFNKERERAVLTFPVVTAALLNDGTDFRDLDTAKFLAKEMSEGNSFFIYTSKSADSLASCCRLRNEVTDNVFSHSLGAGGVMTGSLNVITINMNRLAQAGSRELNIQGFHAALKRQVQQVHKYQHGHLKIYQEYLAQGMLTAYDAGFISMEKQFLTVGLNGLVEAAEFFNIRPDNNPLYRKFVQDTLKVIYDENREFSARTGLKVNTEFVPAESLGVKNAMWDQKDGLKVMRDCYNSYFYRVEDENLSPLDKLNLFDQDMTKYLDGGSALHLNLEDLLDEERWMGMMRCAIVVGVQYFCFNVKSTICNDCGFIDKRTRQCCEKCGSHDVDGATRVIGYLKRVSNFSKARQEEHSRRHYSQV